MIALPNGEPRRLLAAACWLWYPGSGALHRRRSVDQASAGLGGARVHAVTLVPSRRRRSSGLLRVAVSPRKYSAAYLIFLGVAGHIQRRAGPGQTGRSRGAGPSSTAPSSSVEP